MKATNIRKNFEKSVLTVKEMGILISALGELRRVVKDTLSNAKESDNDEDDVLAGMYSHIFNFFYVSSTYACKYVCTFCTKSNLL